MVLLIWMVLGLITGLLARLIVRPNRQLGCLGTSAVGVAGSLVGGTLANLASGRGLDISRAGLVGSVIGAVLILALTRLGDR